MSARRKSSEIEVPPPERILELANKTKTYRDAALVSLLYLSGRRISEVLGVQMTDIAYEQLGKERVPIFTFTVIKRKDKPKIKIPLPPGDPFTEKVLRYVNYLSSRGHAGKLFPSRSSPNVAITRQRAWQILTGLDKETWCHWYRHVRLTHMAATMDNPLELAAFAGWKSLGSAMTYIHSSKSRILEKMRKVE